MASSSHCAPIPSKRASATSNFARVKGHARSCCGQTSTIASELLFRTQSRHRILAIQHRSLLAIATTEVSLHIQGQEWVVGPADDGSFVGKNATSLATVPPTPIPSPTPPTGRTYTLFVKNEGTFLLYTMGDTEGDPVGGQLSRGLFGALNVQPQGAEWYRSQVSQKDLALAQKKNSSGQPVLTPDKQPVLDYNAVYPAGATHHDGTPIPPGTPILKMLDARQATSCTAISRQSSRVQTRAGFRAPPE